MWSSALSVKKHSSGSVYHRPRPSTTLPWAARGLGHPQSLSVPRAPTACSNHRGLGNSDHGVPGSLRHRYAEDGCSVSTGLITGRSGKAGHAHHSPAKEVQRCRVAIQPAMHIISRPEKCNVAVSPACWAASFAHQGGATAPAVPTPPARKKQRGAVHPRHSAYDCHHA